MVTADHGGDRRTGVASQGVVNPITHYGFPQELLTFYEWCNGGELRRGQRDFAPLFTLAEIREYIVAYGVVHFLPNCIAIGMDGGACFYLLDSEQPAGARVSWWI
jgi:hypothetical protein